MNQQSPKYNPVVHWVLLHIRACQFAFMGLLKAPIAQCVTIIVVSIATILPLGFFIVLKNLKLLDARWNNNAPTISLYLKTDFNEDQIQTFISRLKANPKIDAVTYVSPDDGLANFEKTSPLGGALQNLSENPLPGIIMVLPTPPNQNPAAISVLFSELKQSPLVDIAQLDLDWVKRLYNAIIIGQKMTNALSILFSLGIVMIIGNTLRISLLNHLQDIRVLKLIGATNSFIRRPFLYRGILYGLLGGLLACALLYLFIFNLHTPITHLVQTYNTSFQFQGLNLLNIFSVLLLCAALGWAGSWIILQQFLHQSEMVD